MTKQASIALQGLELSVFLGWPSRERAQKQVVTLDVIIDFAAPPTACKTDQLDDTYCYDTLVNHIKQMADARSFRLIEHLGHEIYDLIKQFIQQAETKISIRLVKKPTIENLVGGVAFCYGDS